MISLVSHDEDLLVLDKPSGLLAVPGKGPDLQDCLSARVQRMYPQALIVHRLDRDTSGLIVMALNTKAQRELSIQFANRTVEKRYLAVAFGYPDAMEGLIDLPLRKDFEHPPRHRVDPVAGKPARTFWRLLERESDRCRLELKPETGRSHQIRVHLAEQGHPILGDNLYAHAEALAMAPRLMLHAERLVLTQPRTGERLSFHADCPF